MKSARAWCFALLLSSCSKPATTTNSAPLHASGDLPGSAIIVGTYCDTSDGPYFVHCATQARYSVAREAAFETVAGAYETTPHEPGEKIVVSLVGRFEPLPVVEGSPPRDQLIVDRLLRIWPEETCEKVSVQTPLANTYWKLVELDGKPVTSYAGTREIHMILRLDGHTLGGFGGCNQLAGRYSQQGTNLRFSEIPATPTDCVSAEHELAFTNALDRTTTYQILGESLDLRNDAGSIARFRAVYLR
jgi:heat shock protein HslJ